MDTGASWTSKEVLYGEQTRLTIENMSFSGRRLSEFPIYIRAGAMVKRACAVANFKAGELPEVKAVRIVAACETLVAGRYTEQFPVDVFHGGGGIGINMNLNEVIASLAGAGIRPVDDVNMSQSTADFCHTTLRISLIALLGELELAVEGMMRTLAKKAGDFRGLSTIARTCWQDGMRVPVSAIFEGLLSALERRHERLSEMQHMLHRVNLGWTVIGTGTGATNAYRSHILQELQQVTGLPLRWRKNLYDAAQYPDDLAEVSTEINILAGLLSKFARDLRILSSGPETGLSEFVLPAVQAGSSFFPGKVNPVIPEMMIQCELLVSGNDTVIQRAFEMGEVHLNLWEGMMGFLLIENIIMLTRATTLFDRLCVRGVEPDRRRCEANASSKIPKVVEYREKYGYDRVTSYIKQYGDRYADHLDIDNTGEEQSI